MGSKDEATLSKKDSRFREFTLSGNMWRVIIEICLPLALYQSLQQLFKIFDSVMAAHISSTTSSAVAYLSQISLMLSAIGGGLATGSSIKISEAYGAGDYALVKKRVSTLFALCSVLSILVLVCILPFTTQFLKLANTPDELIEIGRTYFIIELLGMVVSFFDNVYIAIERARGNSKRILHLNFFVIFVKLSLTAFFVYVMKAGITMIAVATLISTLIIFVAAIVNLSHKGNAFSFSFKSISFDRRTSLPMLILSFPVIVEKVAFQFGKVIINSMSTLYGSLTVGALGISNTIGGFTTSPQNGFQEGCAAVISQNLGADKPERAIDAFKKTLLINVILGLIGCILTLVFLPQISHLYAGSDNEYQTLIASVYQYEALGAVTLGINASVMALLYGFGYTHLTLIVNISRVFVFRIPVLWFLQHFTSLGSESVGVVMMVSNISIGVMSSVIAFFQIRKICRHYNIKFFNRHLSH